MTLQYIHDISGKTTGVFIPIEEWNMLKTKYTDLQMEEDKDLYELADWKKEIIDERLNDYEANVNDVVDFDKTLFDIEKSL